MTDVEMGWGFGVCAFAIQLTVLMPDVKMMNFSFLNSVFTPFVCVMKALIDDVRF